MSSNSPDFDGNQLRRELSARYLQILDAIHDMVLVKGPESRIVWANRAFREYYGMSNEQLEDIVDAPFNAPDYTQQYVKDDELVFTTGRSLDIPREPVTRHDGVVRIFHTVKSPIVDATGNVIMSVGVSRDVTDQEAQERTLNEQRIEMARRRSEAHYRALFEMMFESFTINELLFDDAGNPYDFRYLEVNPAFERTVGLTSAQIVGRTLYDLFPDAEPLWIENFFRVVSTGKSLQFEASFGPLGRWFNVSAYRTDPNRFAVIFYDVTERKKAEEMLVAAKGAAENATRTKARFLDTAAHELRTPVTALRILIQFSLTQYEKKGTPVDLATLKRLQGQANRLSRLVVDLLEVSRLERGQIQLKRERTDISSLVSECLEQFRLQVPNRLIRLTKPDQPIWIDLDPARIEQVFSNLMDNALKYTPENTPIDVFVQGMEDLVRVSVQDRGRGISPEHQATLFKPFSSALSDPEEQAAGLGLGLYISRGIISLHGGKLGVRSEMGAGSTFSFELPRKAES